MDRYAARLMLTALLFAAVTVSATLFSDAMTQTAESEPLSVSVSDQIRQQKETDSNQYFISVSVKTPQSAGVITVLDEDGTLVGNWQADAESNAVIGPLAPGMYYVRAKHTGYAKLLLEENAAVYVQAGCGWADGERLYLTNYVPARLVLNCTQPNTPDGIVTLCLIRSDGQKIEQTAYLKNGSSQIVFDGLKAGTYEICFHESVLQTVVLEGFSECHVILPAA